MTTATIRIIPVVGSEALPHLDALAKLRIEVFREFPYLYDGTMEYERKYLATYMQSAASLVVLCFDGDEVVGASTGIPMAHEEESFRRPFVERGFEPSRIFYFGESVLSCRYRGRGIGRRFFELRESHAKTHGFTIATYCAVVRHPDHPSRPKEYEPLDRFWQRLGYAPVPDLTTTYAWRDVGDPGESEKTMQFWLKHL